MRAAGEDSLGQFLCGWWAQRQKKDLGSGVPSVAEPTRSQSLEHRPPSAQWCGDRGCIRC